MIGKYVAAVALVVLVPACGGGGTDTSDEDTAQQHSALCEDSWNEEEGWHTVCADEPDDGGDSSAGMTDPGCKYYAAGQCSMMSCSDGSGASCCAQSDGSSYCCFWGGSDYCYEVGK